MTPVEAAAILGVSPTAGRDEVRRAYRTHIRTHHPDHAGTGGAGRATTIIEAYRVLSTAPASSPAASSSHRDPDATQPQARPRPAVEITGVVRVDGDTIGVGAPADETFRLLLDAAHDVGEITYVDRSMPILEVLCRFEGEPATSLLVTLQGRGTGTEAFCTVESIEARPAPPAVLVIDLLEAAMRSRVVQSPPGFSP